MKGHNIKPLSTTMPATVKAVQSPKLKLGMRIALVMKLGLNLVEPVLTTH